MSLTNSNPISLIRLLNCFQTSIIAPTLENNVLLRTFVSSTAQLRLLRQPLPPTRPPGTLQGAEKPDLVEKYLSLETAGRAELIQHQLQQVMSEFSRFRGDTGSSEVQVALLTARISSVAEHLKQHRKDHNSRRGLQAMLNKRRSLLQYLRRTKFDTYAVLINKLGLKDTYAPQDRFAVRYKAAVGQQNAESQGKKSSS